MGTLPPLRPLDQTTLGQLALSGFPRVPNDGSVLLGGSTSGGAAASAVGASMGFDVGAFPGDPLHRPASRGGNLPTPVLGLSLGNEPVGMDLLSVLHSTHTRPGGGGDGGAGPAQQQQAQAQQQAQQQQAQQQQAQQQQAQQQQAQQQAQQQLQQQQQAQQQQQHQQLSVSSDALAVAQRYLSQMGARGQAPPAGGAAGPGGASSDGPGVLTPDQWHQLMG